MHRTRLLALGMMISSKYQQSKADTTKISTWLARAALAHGYPVDDFRLASAASLADLGGADGSVPSDGQQAESRSKQQLKNAKKNAKKKQKAKAKREAATHAATGDGDDVEDADEQDQPAQDGTAQHGPAPTASQLPSGQYTITAGEYVKLARFLDEKKVDIPLELLQLIRRCIGLRLASLRRFLAAPDLSTLTHEAFIDKLREAGSILHEARERRLNERVEKARAAAGGQGKKEKKPSKNRFESLEDLVQEGEELGDQLPDIQLSEPPRPDKKAPAQNQNATFDLLRSEEEALLDVALFFNDLQDVRDYVRELWEDYRNGKRDLITVSVSTNTAIELLRRPHDEVMSRLEPKLQNSMGDLFVRLYLLTSQPDLIQIGDQYWFRTPDLPTFDMVDDDDEAKQRIYDFFMIPVWQLVDALGRVVTPGCVPIYKPGHFGHYDTWVESFTLPFQQRWQQAKVLCLETLADYLFAVLLSDEKQKQAMFRGDEMARLMNDMVVDKKISLLTLLAAQIFCDINFILRSDVGRGHDELKKEAKRMQATLDLRRSVEPSVQPSSWPAENEAIVRLMYSELGLYTQALDPINKIRARFLQRLPPNERHTKSMLYDRNPCLCGLTLFRMLLNYQELGLVLANAWGTILFTAQLRYAAQQWGTITAAGPQPHRFPRWKDMDLVEEIHGREAIWGGKTPETIDDAQVSFLQMTGHSVQMMQAARAFGVPGASAPAVQSARQRGQQIPRESARGPKGLQETSRLMPIFQAKYQGDRETRVFLDISVIEGLIADMRVQDEAKQQAKDSGLRRARSHKSPKFSVLQLVSVLEKSLEGDEMERLRFDYVAMHLRCIRVLRAVHASADEYLTRKQGPNYMENESQLPFIVGWIFNVATWSARGAESLGLMRDMRRSLGKKGMAGVQMGSRILVGAADAIADFLRTTGEGDAEVRKLGRSAQ
ncbi:hypothetical protein OC844_004382 [Tilletia horrida]|nr:hypothetical protein OC844_004382 [Tilletia horrida]